MANVTLNGNPLDFTAVNGFDIPSGVNVGSNNAAATGRAFASLTTATDTRLYGIELSTGVATDLGLISTGATNYTGLAIQSVQPGTGTAGTPLVGFLDNGTDSFLSRFNSATPADGMLSQQISGIDANEALVGFDFRPATGQLYALGINATADTGTLYLIDPQSPFTVPAVPVGTVGNISFTAVAGGAIDLPDPATTGYGFDFNPAVDRIRVVTGTGLNFRLNPTNPAQVAVDGNGDGSAPNAANGVNPDAMLSGATSKLDAVAYTNGFGQTLGIGGATTLYGLDSDTNSLFIQSNPNGGITTLVGAITVGSVPLDFDAFNGFDIPSGVRAASSNAAVTSGFGFASLTALGVTSLYRIDLTTGAATSLGTVGIGAGGALSGLTAANAPVGTVAFDSPTFTVPENGTNATITLTRTDGSTGAFSVTVGVTGGNATAGTDFGTVPTVVNFADGQTSATFQIPITNDFAFEGNETVVLSLSTPTNGAVLGADDTATLTITDDEVANPQAGTIGFSSLTYSVTEGIANATIVLNRTGGTTGSVTVMIGATAGTATAGTDYGTIPTPVTFADGATTATVLIPITDDLLVEGTETVVLTISAPTGGAQLSLTNSNSVLTILDNETGPGAPPVALSTNLLVGGSLNSQARLFTPDAGSPSYNATSTATISAFGSSSVNVRTAVGDVNGDGTEDTILVTGPGTAIRFAVVSGLDNTTLLIPSTAPFSGSETFTGGGFVSSGDFDNDGRYEVVVTPDQGGGPRVTIFSLVGTTPTVRANFLGIEDPLFRGGARSASGDINGDGIADLAVAAGFQGGPRIAVYNGATVLTAPIRLAADFFAFEQTLRNGAYVAIGDVNGDGFGDLTFGAGPGGAPRVLTIGGDQLLTIGGQAATLAPIANFFVAGNSTDRGGVRVAAKDADGDTRAEIVIGSGEGQPSRVRVYTGSGYVGNGNSEPTGFQDLSVFGGAVLTDGVFVG